MECHCGNNSLELVGTDLRNAKLPRVKFQNTNFHGANLENVDFSGADLTGSDFSGASMQGANLKGARLYECKFHGSDLSHVSYAGANLQLTDLSKAKNFDTSDLESCEHEGVKLPTSRPCSNHVVRNREIDCDVESVEGAHQ